MTNNIQINTTELEGMSFDCLDGCAMCCYCQPELSDDELGEFLEVESLSKGLTAEHYSGAVTEKPNAIKLQGGCGACYFLKSRRCLTYDLRPQMCRQFPIRIHALENIQLNVNLSCRGIVNDGGSTLLEFGRKVIGKHSQERLTEHLSATRESNIAFEARCRDNQIYQSPVQLVSTAEHLIPILSSPDGLGRLIAFTSESPRIGNMMYDEIATAIQKTNPPEDLSSYASEANYGQFELENPAWLPIYIDGRYRLNTFRSNKGAIEWLYLAENGTLELQRKFDPYGIKLLEMDPTAIAVLIDYAKVLLGRDHFRGYAYYVCSDAGFGSDMMTVYLGVLATVLIDLWWRTSLIGKMHKKNIITGDLAKEGVVAFDMDMLDAPTIGGFL